jgi:pyroglutamyl-peptidase
MRREPKVLLTGFEPFGDWTRNVSGEAVRRLDGRRLAGVRLVGRELPVAYPRALRVLDKLLREIRPEAVVALGIQRPRRRAFRVESVARNALDFTIPDNDGRLFRKVKIEPAGPARRTATLPAEEVFRALRDRGLPARRSTDAGRYLCNAVYYRLLGRAPLAVFIHVPPRRESERIDDIIIAVEAAARAAARAVTSERVEA